MTANNSTNSYIGCFNIYKIRVTANNSTNSNIGCLNIHETHVSANKSSNNNVVFFFCFIFEIVIL